jgi:four helix bundle protein
MTESKGLETLQVWQKAIAFAITLQKNLLPSLPIEEKWALTSQLRRSVQSVPANIAEGFGRYYYQEGIHFCYLARGSLEETFSHVTLANKLGYISQDTYKTYTENIQ